VSWGQRLQEAGFRRFRVFHGDTPPVNRKEIMNAWRADQVDVVVATSAFGMGVDKPDVRSVVHACFPEGIDRFYQEVGRGGRDGEPCVSLLVPKRRDERVASIMGPTLLSDPEKINGRWRAMWETRSALLDENEEVITGVFRLRTDVQPTHRFGSQSYSENVRWNKRLLLMMDRAGLVRIESIAWERVSEDAVPCEFAVVRPCCQTMELDYGLADLLAQHRQSEIEAIRRASDSLVRYFRRETPVCRELKAHYGSNTSRACGSCAACRSRGEQSVVAGPLSLDEESAVTQPLVQVVQAPRLDYLQSHPILVQALRQVLQSLGINRFVVDGAHRDAFETLIDRADDNGYLPYRIDDLNGYEQRSINPKEIVLVLHVDAIDLHAGALNRHGRSVVHWLLGGNIESTPGSWPFMHDYGARAYPGKDGLSQWLYDSQQLVGQPQTFI
jgi:ATP-dependent DNA helicase RecQ